MKIFYLEDNPSDFRLFAEHFETEVELQWAEDMRTAHNVGDCDIALLDLNLITTQGAETVRRFRKQFPYLPVIVLTHINDDRMRDLTLNAGAHSYFIKGNYLIADLLKAMREAAEQFKRDAVLRESQKALNSNVLKELLSNMESLITRIDDRLSELED